MNAFHSLEQVSIDRTDRTKRYCSGVAYISPITQRVNVITAAHCVENLKLNEVCVPSLIYSIEFRWKNDIYVRYYCNLQTMVTAEHKGDVVSGGLQGKNRKIELCIRKITLHPNFDRNTRENDIAIVHVSNSFYAIERICWLSLTIPSMNTLEIGVFQYYHRISHDLCRLMVSSASGMTLISFPNNFLNRTWVTMQTV